MREKNSYRRRVMLAGLFVLGLGACTPEQGADTPGEKGKVATAESAPTAKPAAAPAGQEAAKAVEVKEETDNYTFLYAYPAQAAAQPGLKALLDGQLKSAKDGLMKETGEGRADAEKNGYPYRPYDLSTEWAVVTDLPDWLSLSATIYSYTGGAHGNTGYDSLLWDKKAGKERPVLSLFTSEAALEKAVQQPLCAGLDRERAKRRGEKVVRNQDDWMSACIGIKDTTPILGSAGKTAFDRIGFLIGPYAAGPYAEGSYDVTLPVTPAVIAAVKPEFRAAFAAGR